MSNTREGLSDSDDFEKPFRDKLTDLEDMPPLEGWDAIQSELDRDRGIDRRWYLLLLLLLVGAGGFMGGYWVSQVGIEHEQAGMVESSGDSRFKIQDSEISNLAPEQAQLPVEQECDEVESTVDHPQSTVNGGVTAYADRNTNVKEGYSEKEGGADGQSVRHVRSGGERSMGSGRSMGNDQSAGRSAGSDEAHYADRIAGNYTAGVKENHTPVSAEGDDEVRVGRRGDGVNGHENGDGVVGDHEYAARSERADRPGDGRDRSGSMPADRATQRLVTGVDDENLSQNDQGLAESRLVTGADDKSLPQDDQRQAENRLVQQRGVVSTAPSAEGPTVRAEQTVLATGSADDHVQADTLNAKKGSESKRHAVAAMDQAKAGAAVHSEIDGHSQDSAAQRLNGAPQQLYPGQQQSMPVVVTESADSVHHHDETKEAVAPVGEEIAEKKKKEFEPSKWMLQLSVGGNYVFKKLTPSEDLYYITDLTNKNQFSVHNAGYNLAARVRREVGSKTTLVGGLSWSRWQTNVGYHYYHVVADSMAVQQITANSIEVNTFFMKRSNEIRTTVQQVGLSLGVLQKVKVLQRTHTVLLEANLYQKISATSRSNQVGHDVEVRPMHVAIKAGVEKTVDVGAWRFTITPYVQRYLGSLYTGQSLFQFNPLQVGVDVGLLLPLQKK